VAAELLFKAALRLVGIEPTKGHDERPILKDVKKGFPEWFQEDTDELASISRSHERERASNARD
jgi:HEPN domain-containing protein